MADSFFSHPYFFHQMIRRFNLKKAEPQAQGDGTKAKDEGYRCHSADDELVWETLRGGGDADDVVWESLSSLTLQDHSGKKRRFSPFMLFHDSPMTKKISSETLLNDTIIKGATDTTLLRIAEHCPGLLGLRGDYGRFPVHVACAHAASTDFISKCVSLHPRTAAAQDNEGKTPFHILCNSYAKSCNSLSMSQDVIERRMTSIIWVLYRKAPTAIILEDSHGVDVVEYALEAELSLHFIRLLQDLVARVHKSNSKKKAHRNLMNTHSQLHQNDSSEWVTML
jgi:hypothetical protein